MRTAILRAVLPAVGVVLLTAGLCQADQVLVVPSVSEPPAVDGNADDTVWAALPGIVVRDAVADIPIEMKAVRADDRICFLVRYPDPEPSTAHRSWIWSERDNKYESGPDREDCFVFKWLLTGEGDDLTLSSDEPYTADVWFWKACRTNPVGYADDKIQSLSRQLTPRSRPVTSRSGSTLYLQRTGDHGAPSYRTRVVLENEGAKISRFTLGEPTASRADIRAKGVWADGWWTVEFERVLVTGNPDDVQFHTGDSYRFGVSRYEIAGRERADDSAQPLYGCGEVGEKLTLVFAPVAKDGTL